MSVPIVNSPLVGHFVEYNNYRFNAKSRSHVSIHGNKDSSGREVVTKTYVVNISSIVVPRRPIPGDEFGLGIQPPAPQELVVKPGYYPWHYNATVDSEMNIIRCKLEEQGKTFRYCGQGIGDIYVNTIDPNTGKYVPDLNYGPFTRVLNMKPTGFNKAWHVDWTIEFTIQNCCSSAFDTNKLDYNDPKNRIQEYNYSVQYHIGQQGYTRRTIHGHLVIIPPIYRYETSLPVLGLNLKATNAFITTTLIKLSELKTKKVVLEKAIKDSQNTLLLLYMKLVNYLFTLNKTDKERALILIRNLFTNKDLASRNQINIYLAANFISLFGLNINLPNLNNLVTILEGIIAGSLVGGKVIDPAVKTLIGTNIDIQDLVNVINLFQSYYDTDVATSPYQNDIYPKAVKRSDIKPRDAFGPYKEDNVGHLQNYETVDQYRELIEDSIELPHGFSRMEKTYNISQDKRSLTFSITDEEQPAFSLVPGYTKVNFRQHTHTHGKGAVAGMSWQSTLSGKFHFPKFINNEFDRRLRDGIDAGHSTSRALPWALSEDKVREVPDRIVAYMDFMKVFYQRYALVLLTNHPDFNPALVNGVKTVTLKGKDGTQRTVNQGGILMVDFSMREGITDNDIEFSTTVNITTPMEDIFVVTGAGLPLIIASDLNVDFIKRTKANGRVQDVVDMAEDCLFGEYYDVLKHIDYKSSHAYSTLSPRGSAGLVFDRTYDRPYNICHDPTTKIEHIIPKHRAPTNFLGDFDNFERNQKKMKANLVPGVNDLPAGNAISNLIKGVIGMFKSKYDLLLAEDFGIVPINEFNPMEPFQDGDNSVIDISTYTTGNFTLAESQNTGIYGDEGEDFEPEDDEQEVRSDPVSIKSSTFFNRTVENLVFDKLLLLIGTPPPTRSWISYTCSLETDVKNYTIRHRPLPISYVGPIFGLNEEESYIQGNFDDRAPTGKSDLIGDGNRLNIEQEAVVDDSVIQVVGSPSNTIILRGNALRVAYPIVPPTMLAYGKRLTYQIRRIFNQGVVGKSKDLVYYGEWEITYITSNIPEGRLGYPDHPYYTGTKDYPNGVLKDIREPTSFIESFTLGAL